MGSAPIFILVLRGDILVEHEQVEFVDWPDQIEGDIFLFLHFELEDQGTLLVIEEVGEGLGVLQLDEGGLPVDYSQCELAVVKCDDLEDEVFVFGGLVDGGEVVVEAGFVALLVDEGALFLAGCVDHHAGCVYQQLDGLVRLGAVGIVTDFADVYFGADLLLERFDYEFAYVFVFTLSDVEIALATLFGLDCESAASCGTAASRGSKFGRL